MDFYKKAAFVFILIVFGMVVLIKSLEPVVERQISQVFSDKKMSKKINKELMGMTEDFTPEKKEFYKKIIVSLYTKWIPLFEEAKIEAYQKLNKSK
tara:strand:+ start:487 stop:774 length:288 start_codon:yes stop_codon:yes gene_type:complete